MQQLQLEHVLYSITFANCLEEWEQINPDEDDVVSVQHGSSSRQAASTIRDAIKNYLNSH